NGEAGASFGLKATVSGVSNSGYAGYFNNAASGNTGYAVYGTNSSANGFAGYFNGNVAINAGSLSLTSTAAAPTNGIYKSGINALTLTTSAADALTVTSTGGVGIGTATPTQKLDVAGNLRLSGSRSVIFTQGDNNTTHVGGLQLITPDNGGTFVITP